MTTCLVPILFQRYNHRSNSPISRRLVVHHIFPGVQDLLSVFVHVQLGHDLSDRAKDLHWRL